MADNTGFSHILYFSPRIRLTRDGPKLNLDLTLHPEQVHALEMQSGAKVTIPTRNIEALIDTGATYSSVLDEIALQLGLNQVGSVPIAGAHYHQQCPVYSVELMMGPFHIPCSVVGLKPKHKPNIECLLGRDVLQFFTMYYVGPCQSFVLYHGIPPLYERPDPGDRIAPQKPPNQSPGT